MFASPSLIGLTVSIALMVYLSAHHLALAGRSGNARIHLGIGMVGGASLILSLTRVLFYLAVSPEISVLAMRGTLAAMCAVIWLLVWVSREFAGTEGAAKGTARGLRAFGLLTGTLAVLALVTPWGASDPCRVQTDMLGQTYTWVTMGPLVPVLAVVGTIGFGFGMWMLFRSNAIDNVMRALIVVAFVVYLATGLSDALLSTGHGVGVALFEHAYVVLAVVFDTMAVRRFRALSSDLEREVLRRTDELSAKNRDLAAALQDASLASRAKSEFVANMSHEIRTPLNGVVGLLEVLGRTSLDAAQRDYVRTMRGSSEALMAIVNQVLDFSQLRGSNEALTLAPVDATSLAEEIVARLAVRAQERGIELGVITEPADRTFPKIQANLNALTQVLTNLIGNAIKFTQSGSVCVKIDAHEGMQRIRVIDTGPGIQPDILSTLFDPFVTSSATDPERLRGAGTGLGLAIAKELTERMGGTIQVETIVGKGSTFTLLLPTREMREPTAARVVQRATRAAVTRGAWMIDVPGLTGTALRSQLVALGASVEPMGAAEAEERLRQGADPACILGSDVLAMDELARVLLQRAKGPGSVKVFAVSRVGAADEITGPRLGATPLRVPTTRAWLREALAGNEVSAAMVRSVHAQLHVLVAEDNAVNRKVAELLLKEVGITMDVVENGALAVEAAKKRRYDAILMDCQMPVMDGFEAARAIRAHELATHAKRVPILAVTAHVDVTHRDEIFAAGMDAHVPKPLRLDALLRVLAPYGKRDATPTGVSSRPVTTQALISEDRVLELCALGDHEVTESLVQQLESDLAQAHEEIQRALTAEPLERTQIRALAHRVKGAALALGAQHLSTTAAKLEKSTAEGAPEELKRLAEALRTASEPSVAALREAFARVVLPA
jgi:signal transduction histidine kinase/CheY-like chemotaxis protein